MKTLELWLINYLVNSLWQVPLVVLAAWTAARLARTASARAEHRIWAGALVLESLLPACHFQPGDVLQFVRALVLWSTGGRGGETRIFLGPATADGTGMFHLSPALMSFLLIAYLATLLYFCGRLAWGLWKTGVMVKTSTPLLLEGDLLRTWERSGSLLPGRTRIRAVLAVSPMISGPVTVGARRRILLVPPGFVERLAPGELDALLAHEFAHMRRHDFPKNILYGIISLPVAFHPLLWLTRARIAESRELVCDAMAAEAVAGREAYARSLLRLASLLSAAASGTAIQAIAIFDTNNFERRIMQLNQKRVEVSTVRRLATAGICAAITLAACGSALALRVEFAAPDSQNSQKIPTRVNPKDLKFVKKIPPVYPARAKASGDTINGSVELDVVVGKTGEPENIRVKKSLREEYDQNAIDAVRQWRWQPVLFNGEPIEVLTTITINYTLEK